MAFLIPLAVAGASAATAGSTLATVGAVASVAAAGIGAFGAIQQGKAASDAANYNAKVAENNAKTAQQNASYKGAEGEANAAAEQMKTRAQVAAIAAGQAGSGIDVNKGSAVDVRAAASSLGQLDAMTIRSNAAREAYGYQTQATSDTAQSQLDRSTAKNSSKAGLITGAGTFLSGAGSAALNFANFQNDKSAFNTGGLGGDEHYDNSFAMAGG